MSETIKKYNKGDVIFEQGIYENWMYDIKSGSVGIYIKYGTTDQKQIATLDENDTFGEMGLIDSHERSASAVALEDNTEVEVITLEVFEGFLKANPRKIIKIMSTMSNRMRELTNDYRNACTAIGEYLHAEEQNIPKSKSLLDRMKEFVESIK